MKILFVSLLSLLVSGCTYTASPALNADQKLRAMRLISVFENGSPELAFEYVEALNDGRGYTCGLGFTTATKDAYEVAEAYTKIKPENPLAPLIPTLKQLVEEGSDSISELDAFPGAWKEAARDRVFQKLQLEQSDRDSYLPALEQAKKFGVKTALGIAILYETIWMHGNDDDPDGTPALIHRAIKRQQPFDEAEWLKIFLEERHRILLNPHKKESREEWSKASVRIEVLQALLRSGNFHFTGPIDIGGDFDVRIP